MPLINCKVELKLKWQGIVFLSAAGNDNANANNIFTMKDTKLYVPVVTISERDNQKLSKLLLLESVEYLFEFIQIKIDSKRFKTQRYYLHNQKW